MAKHFEFKDWEAAFAYYYEVEDSLPGYSLVISTHWVTSGYWIERDPKPTQSEPELISYKGKEAVKALEDRIRERGEEVVRTLPNGQPLRRKECLNLGGLVT